MATPTDAQPESDLRVGILGPLEVHRGGVPCVLGGRQQRFVLALLALETGHAVSLDRIADALWGDELPASYVTTIQSRRTLGTVVRAMSGSRHASMTCSVRPATVGAAPPRR